MPDLINSVIAVILFGALVPLLALPWIHRQYVRYGRLSGWSAVVAAAAVLYLCGLVAFTLFPLPQQTAASCAGVSTADFLHLNPLTSVEATPRAVLQLLLNVVLFVPLGFLARYRFRLGVAAATALGLGVSLLVETVQGTAVLGLFACPYRVADTGDLITNTTGAFLGWLLAAATVRLLPDPQPVPSADVEVPGVLRRGLAVGADLLIGFLGVAAAGFVVILTGGLDLANNAVTQIVLHLAVLTTTTLVVPSLRADRATLGQVAFFLAPAGADATSAVRIRFLVWWLPVSLLQATDNTTVVVLAAIVIGVLARFRADRRSVLELLTRTPIDTRGARQAELELSSGRAN